MKKIVIALALGMLLGSAVTAVAATNETVQAVFSKFAITVNGQPKELKTDPLVVDGTSYLPVREVANLVGYDVDYEDATRTIILKEKEAGTVNNVDTDGYVSLREKLIEGKFILHFNQHFEGIQKGDIWIKIDFANASTNMSAPTVVKTDFVDIRIFKKDGGIDDTMVNSDDWDKLIAKMATQ